MGDIGVGQTIRDARLRNGRTIEQLSNVTRINSTALRAMEAEEFERLPGAVFARGFFRSYAQEVGLDPDATVAMYVAQTRAASASGSAAVPSDGPESDDVDERSPVAEGSSDLTQMILIAIIVATVGYLGLHNQPAATVAASTPATVGRDVPVGTSGTVDPAERTAAGTPDLRLEIQAIGPCWMSATADGAPVAARLMDQGDTQAIAAHDEIRLRLGDPTSVSFSLNGVAGRSLGNSGQAVSIRITPENLGEFQLK